MEFVVKIDNKQTVWQSSEYKIKADSREEAEQFAKERLEQGGTYLYEKDKVEHIGSVFLFETTENMSPHENDGQATVEAYMNDEEVFNNSENK